MIVHFLFFEIIFFIILGFHNALISSQKQLLMERLATNLKFLWVVFSCINLRAASFHLILGADSDWLRGSENMMRLLGRSFVPLAFVRSGGDLVAIVSNFFENPFKLVRHIVIFVGNFLINLLKVFVAPPELLNFSVLSFKVFDQFLNFGRVVALIFLTFLFQVGIARFDEFYFQGIFSSDRFFFFVENQFFLLQPFL